MFHKKYNEERDIRKGVLRMAKMGRPKTDDPREKSLGVRVTNDEYKVIKEYAKEHDMTITETLLKGVKELIKEPAK